MPAEPVTAQPFIKNAEARMEAGRKADALRELHMYFNRASRASFEWSSHLDEYVKLHAKLSVELRDDRCVQDALSKFRSKFQQQHTLEKFPAVVGAYMAEAKRMLENAKTKAAEEAKRNTSTAIGRAVRELTGASLESLSEERGLEASFALYHTMMNRCIKSLSMDGTMEKYFQFAMQAAFNTYREAGRLREFMGLCSVLRHHTDMLTNNNAAADSRQQEHKALLLSDKYFADNLVAIMKTKHIQMRTAAHLGNWDNVYNGINEMRAIMTEFRRNGRLTPLEQQQQYTADLKDICFMSKQYAFGAHAAIGYAFQNSLNRDKSKEEVMVSATEAVMAVLCVSPVARRATVSIAHDADKEKLNQLAKAFMLPAPPTRASLTVDLQRRSVLEMAHPVARELFARLSNPQSVSICQTAAPLLAELAKVDSAVLAPLVLPIQKCAVRSLLGVVASCFSHVSIPHFMSLVAFFPASDFSSVVEPLVVDVAGDPNSSISVAIDDASHSIRFESTASMGTRAVGIESEFSQRLSAAVHNCFAAPARPAKAAQKPTQLLTRIEEERTRIFMRASLCNNRIDKQQEREKLAKEREEQRKADDLKRRQQREAERNEKRREVELRKLARQVAAQEAVERRKWVIKHIMTKHKGFVASNDIAKLPQEEFAEALSTKLLEFRRKLESTKESDTKSMDYYERACREEEIPRREKHEAEMAEANARNVEERRENRRRQHRQDWEKAVETKHRLEKFATQRRRYEESLGAALKNVAKVSKADKEAADLDAFKAARAAMAGETVDAAQAPAAESSPTGGGGGAKWAPKARR